MNKFIKIGVALAVVAILAVMGAKKIEEAKAKDATKPIAKVYPINVDTMKPTIAQAKLTLPYLADVKNDKDVVLSSRISARVISIKHSGSVVKKGDIVATLDTTTIKSNLSTLKDEIKASEVALKNIEATHKRTLDLIKVQGASVELSQKEITQIASTQAKLAGLKQKEIELNNNLSYAVIKSPVDGVIAQSMSSVGSVSMPGKPIAKISSKNGFYLMVRVPREIDIKGVTFNKKDYPLTALGSTYHGLAEYKVYTGTSNLTTGDRVEIDVITYNAKGLLLPFDALLNRDNRSFVLIVNGKKAITQEVHILKNAQQGVIVSEDLTGKTIVIAKPDILLKLTSGYALKVRG